MRIWREAGRLLSLLWSDFGFLIEAAWLPPAVYSSFRIAGVPRTQKWLRRWADKRDADSARPALAIITPALRAQRVVKRFTGIGGTCLVRSLTLWAMLRSRGVAANVRIGMRKRAGKTEGHAWVEFGDRAINENDSEVRTYTVYPDSIAFDLWVGRPNHQELPQRRSGA